MAFIKSYDTSIVAKRLLSMLKKWILFVAVGGVLKFKNTLIYICKACMTCDFYKNQSSQVYIWSKAVMKLH